MSASCEVRDEEELTEEEIALIKYSSWPWTRIEEMEENFEKGRDLDLAGRETTAMVVRQWTEECLLWSRDFGAIYGGGDQKEFKVGHFRKIQIEERLGNLQVRGSVLNNRGKISFVLLFPF